MVLARAVIAVIFFSVDSAGAPRARAIDFSCESN
jgi:hypothetical protein